MTQAIAYISRDTDGLHWKKVLEAALGPVDFRTLGTLGNIDEIEIAYAFKREFWGQGLASEVAIALTDIGLSHHELPSLIGLVYVDNGASRRVLEKANYTLEKSTMRHGEDVVIYRIQRREA